MAVSSKTSKANIAELRAAGVPDSLIANYGGKLNNAEKNRILNSFRSQSLPGEDQLPDSLKNDPAYSKLTRDMKEVVLYNYQIQKTNDEQKAIHLSNALQQATEQAEPYWKNVLLIAQDEVLRSFEQVRGDYNSSVDRQLRIIDSINQDLATNKNFLSLEEQSSLATLARNYRANHDELLDSAAGAGLTFSTKRQIAEQRLNEENQGMVESTKRQFGKQQRDLEMNALRGLTESNKEIEDLTRRVGEAQTTIGRGAEKYLGTSNLPTLPGYTALGNTPGQLYEEKVKDIDVRKQTLYNELNAGSLNLSLQNML